MSAVVLPFRERRAPLARRAWWERKPKKSARRARPGATPPMPPGWAHRAELTLRRDSYLCRRCGAVTCITLRAVDHVIPRRLFATGRAASAARNLATLCSACHGWKTSTLEPALYRGNILAFESFLTTLALSGPTPTPAMLATAYGRLRRLLR